MKQCKVSSRQCTTIKKRTNKKAVMIRKYIDIANTVNAIKTKIPIRKYESLIYMLGQYWFLLRWHLCDLLRKAQVFAAWLIFPLLLLSSSSHFSGWNFFPSPLLHSSTHPYCFLVLTPTLPVPLLLLHAVPHIRHLTPPSSVWNCGAIIARPFGESPIKRVAGRVDERSLVLGED